MLKIKNWDKFQSYKDGRPLHWVKWHVDVLDDYTYSQLDLEPALLFPLLLALVARLRKNEFQNDANWIASAIHRPASFVRKALPKLIQAGLVVENRTDSYDNHRAGA